MSSGLDRYDDVANSRAEPTTKRKSNGKNVVSLSPRAVDAAPASFRGSVEFLVVMADSTSLPGKVVRLGGDNCARRDEYSMSSTYVA